MDSAARLLDDAAAFVWARSVGVPLVETVVVGADDDPVSLASHLGFPVVAKTEVDKGCHKTDLGAVRVGIATPQGLREAVRHLRAIACKTVTVQPELVGVEAMVGVVRDRSLGPFVVVGVGGTLAELIDDVAVVPAPLCESDARAAINSTRLASLLAGLRGAPGGSTEALVHLMVTIGEAAGADAGLESVDLNPVFVGPDGVTAVDVRVLRRNQAGDHTRHDGARRNARHDGARRDARNQAVTVPRDLTALFSPRSVAVVGASRHGAKPGSRALRYLRNHGFGGDVMAVNPKGNVPHVTTVAAITDLEPGTVDLACVAMPARHVPDAVVDLAERGVGAVVIFTDGMPDADAAHVARVARETGMVVVGPNSSGVAHFADGVVASMAMVFDLEAPPAGTIGIVSQSGAIGSCLISRGWDLGIGFSAWVSTGNEINVGVADCLAHLADDPATNVVLLYLETIRDGAATAAALASCRRRGTTVVALRSGTSAAARRVSETHSGALAGDDRRTATWLRHHGVVEVDTVDELLVAGVAGAAHRRRPGNRVGVVTMSGGAAALVADACERRGLDIPKLAPPTVAALAAATGIEDVHNPVDVSADAVLSPQVVCRCAEAMSADPAIDAVIVQLTTNADPAASVMAAGLAELTARSPKPILVSRLGSPRLAPGALVRYRAAGIPVFDSPGAVAVAARVILDPRKGNCG